MRMQIILPLMLVLAALPCQAGDIFKWQENGKTIYGEYPPVGIQAERINRATGSVMTPSEEKAAAKTVDDSQDTDEPDAPAVPSGQSATAGNDMDDVDNYKKVRNDNCASAKRNLGLLQTGGHHRFRTSDGNIAYLDEAETKRRIEEAKSHIRDYCN